MHQYVERFGDTGSRYVLALYNRFVCFGAADDIIGLDGEQLLQDVGSTVGFEGPHFHFPETLTTELGFTTQGLLRDKAVRPNAPGVHLIVHHVVQLDHIDHAHSCFLVEALTGFTIIEIGVTK